jgi:ribosome biogenesis GTPase A
METQNYNVEFDDFCERHYIKSFSKKYKSAWDGTQSAIEEVCKRIDAMLLYNRADLITTNGDYKLVKLDFSVEGTKISPKASGNRCILVVNENTHSVRILLVYSKNDISSPNETAKWKTAIKEQYSDVKKIFGL